MRRSDCSENFRSQRGRQETKAIFIRVNYCTDTTNPATAIAENDDKRPADLVMTDDCRVDRQIW